MKPETATKLREPFPADVIGKLPKLSCRDCKAAPGKVCGRHTKQRCSHCGNNISTAHVDLDFVGHAPVTGRLLTADPAWFWEPVAWAEDGSPLIRKGADGALILWIRLTVDGVTRLGVGSVESGAFDAEKQLIGDAIRNAAMRFGVALDLWAKDGLEHDEDEVQESSPSAGATAGQQRGSVSQRPRAAGSTPPVAPPHESSDLMMKGIRIMAKRRGMDDAALGAFIDATLGHPVESPEDANKITEALTGREGEDNKTKAAGG